jgi:hypothetical protein
VSRCQLYNVDQLQSAALNFRNATTSFLCAQSANARFRVALEESAYGRGGRMRVVAGISDMRPIWRGLTGPRRLPMVSIGETNASLPQNRRRYLMW